MSRITFGLCILILAACKESREQEEVALNNTYCASCHTAPDIPELSKKIWKDDILPEMGARLGIRENDYDPYMGLLFTEMEVILITSVFPDKSIINPDDREVIREYVLRLAPDSTRNPAQEKYPAGIPKFTEHPISLDSNGRSFISFLKFDTVSNKFIVGELSGRVMELDLSGCENKVIGSFRNSVVDYSSGSDTRYVTTIRSLRPSEISADALFYENSGVITPIPEKFHRPVSTLVNNFNKDGNDELVVFEFGDLSGSRSHPQSK